MRSLNKITTLISLLLIAFMIQSQSPGQPGTGTMQQPGTGSSTQQPGTSGFPNQPGSPGYTGTPGNFPPPSTLPGGGMTGNTGTQGSTGVPGITGYTGPSGSMYPNSNGFGPTGNKH